VADVDHECFAFERSDLQHFIVAAMEFLDTPRGAPRAHQEIAGNDRLDRTDRAIEHQDRGARSVAPGWRHAQRIAVLAKRLNAALNELFLTRT
jgi:hypothetical protein